MMNLIFICCISLVLSSCGNVRRPKGDLNSEPVSQQQPDQQPENAPHQQITQPNPEHQLPNQPGSSQPRLQLPVNPLNPSTQSLFSADELAALRELIKNLYKYQYRLPPQEQFNKDIKNLDAMIKHASINPDYALRDLDKLAADTTYFPDHNASFTSYQSARSAIDQKLSSYHNELDRLKNLMRTFESRLSAATELSQLKTLAFDIKNELPKTEGDEFYQQIEARSLPTTLSQDSAKYSLVSGAVLNLAEKIRKITKKYYDLKYLNQPDKVYIYFSLGSKIIDNLMRHNTLDIDSFFQADEIKKRKEFLRDFATYPQISVAQRDSLNANLQAYDDYERELKNLSFPAAPSAQEVTNYIEQRKIPAELATLKQLIHYKIKEMTWDVSSRNPPDVTADLNGALNTLKSAARFSSITFSETNLSKIEAALNKTLNPYLDEIEALKEPDLTEFIWKKQSAKDYTQQLGGILSKIDLQSLDALAGSISVIGEYRFDDQLRKKSIVKRPIVQQMHKINLFLLSKPVYLKNIDNKVAELIKVIIKKFDAIRREIPQ